MQNQTLTESLAAFDPEIYGLLQEEVPTCMRAMRSSA